MGGDYAGNLINQGHNTTIEEFPYVSNIHTPTEMGPKVMWQCTAFIIGPKHMLTVASCFHNESKVSNFCSEVVVGSINGNPFWKGRKEEDNGYVVQNSKRILHEGMFYDFKHKKDDVAVLEFENPFEFTAKVQPIRIVATKIPRNLRNYQGQVPSFGQDVRK